jgi:biuret amidohydrolase
LALRSLPDQKAVMSRNPALIVVDMQAYFLRPDSVIQRVLAALSPQEADEFQRRLPTVVSNIATLLETARGNGWTVAYTEFGSREAEGADLPLWARRQNDLAMSVVGERGFLPLSDTASRVIPEIAPAVDELVVTKTTSGPLAGTTLYSDLRSRDIDAAIVTGIMTDVCVQGMARELADCNFDVAVVTDAVAGTSRAAHDAALMLLGSVFAELVSTDQISEWLAGHSDKGHIGQPLPQRGGVGRSRAQLTSLPCKPG